jgi:hypothetical protein
MSRPSLGWSDLLAAPKTASDAHAQRPLTAPSTTGRMSVEKVRWPGKAESQLKSNRMV